MDEQQYLEWMGNREAILEELRDTLDDSIGEALDFSPASLDVVGAYLVESFASLAELHRPENRSVHLGLSTYAFEVFRRNLALEPRLPREDPRYEYYGVPVLSSPAGSDVSPFNLVTYTVHRQKADLMGWVFGNQVEQIARELADLEQEGSAAGPAADSFEPMSEEEFNSWLTFITDQLERFLSGLDEETRKRFDFSPESLRFVGEVTVARTSGRDGVFPQDSLFRHLYTYVGEVFHRNLGLQFVLPGENDPAAGQPALRNPSGEDLSLPWIVTETARRQDPEFAYTRFERVRDGWILPGGAADR